MLFRAMTGLVAVYHNTTLAGGLRIKLANQVTASDSRKKISLGRTLQNPVINETHKQQLSADQRRWVEVEGVFGSGKRKYLLRLIMARLANGAENSISMAFLVMCAEKIRRLLQLFFVFFSAWFYKWQRPSASWMVLMHIWRLVTSEPLLTA